MSSRRTPTHSVTVRKSADLVGFDANRATETARSVVGDDLLVSAEYTPESFQVLYLADRLVDRWGNTDDLMDVGEAIHAYMHEDFCEQRRFDDLYPSVSETYGFVTYTDRATIVRVLRGDEGLYLSLAPDTVVTPVVDQVKEVLEES